MADEIRAGNVETVEKDIGTDPRAVVERWKSEIEIAEGEEFKKWISRGEDIIKRYRDEETRTDQRFNILLANTETLKPAVFGQPPTADVRRRITDPRFKDPAAREAAVVLERSLSHAMDDYDFYGTVERAVTDFLLPGRGVVRVKYKPHYALGDRPRIPLEQYDRDFDEDGDVVGRGYRSEKRDYDDLDVLVDDDGFYAEGEAKEEVVYEQALCEYVYWRDFGFTQARCWQDVRAIWFKHELTRKQLKERFPTHGGQVNLDVTPKGLDNDKLGLNHADMFKKATVYEVWDKDERKVIVIAPHYDDAPLAELDDPLGLEEFFPTPEPLDFFRTNDTMIPIASFRSYQDQANELDEIQSRISNLTEMLKVRGFYDASVTALQSLLEKDDGELVGVDNYAERMEASGTNGILTLLELDEIVKALIALYQHREQLKQTIYEITGISDVLRGQTNPEETAKAQTLKAQFGSFRHQTPKQNVERYARDILRLKAEIMAEHFSQETFQMVSGVKLLTAEQKQAAEMQIAQQAAQAQQAQQMGGPPPPPPDEELVKAFKKPTWEEVIKLLRSDVLRGFAIDVETDSTVMVDRERAQRDSVGMIKATSEFVAQAASIIESAPPAGNFMLQLLRLGLRHFKPGRLVEEALDDLAAQIEDAEPQGQQEPPPDPEAMAKAQKIQQDMQIAEEQAKLKAEAEMKKMEREEKLADLKMQIMQMEAEAEQNRKNAEQNMKAEERQINEARQAEDRQNAETARNAPQPAPITLAMDSSTGEVTSVADGTGKVVESVAQFAEMLGSLLQAQAERDSQQLQAQAQRDARQDERMAELMGTMEAAMERVGGPKEIVFKQGKPVGIRPAPGNRTVN